MKLDQLLESKDHEFQGEVDCGVHLDLKSVNEDGTFEGWAAIYGNVDNGDDIIQKGAFAESLRERGAKEIKFLYQHRIDIPIGVWVVVEDRPNGLWVKGKFITETQAGKDAYILTKEGAVDGLSIGYRTLEHAMDGDVRNIIKADLREISLVTFPMNELARVQQVKNSDLVPTKREIERSLMRDARLSKQQAQSLLAKGYAPTFETERDAGQGDAKEIENLLKQATELLRA